MNEAIEKSKKLGYKSIVVLGHENYYPKFGFKKASNYGIKAPFDVPDEAYMVLELTSNALNEVNGVVEYSKAFLNKKGEDVLDLIFHKYKTSSPFLLIS